MQTGAGKLEAAAFAAVLAATAFGRERVAPAPAEAVATAHVRVRLGAAVVEPSAEPAR